MPRNNQQNDVDLIFSKALKGKSIFTNHKALQSDFIPEHLPFRNNQLSTIAQILAPLLHGSKPSNVLIYGKTGTGKTAATKYVISKLSEKSKQNENIKFVYSNARMTGTEYRTLAELAYAINLKIPFTGLALTEVLSRIQNYMKDNELKSIFVIDEIDYLIRGYGDDLLYGITTLSDKISPGFLSIIGISNDLKFKEDLGARVQSRLSEEEIVFPPYTVEELRTILEERASLALNSKTYTQASINLVAALSGSEHGDARRALDLLRIAGEVAERDGSDQLDERHVRIALQKIDQDRISEALRTLPIHAKLVLLAAIFCAQEESNKNSSGALYEKYSQMCNSSGLEMLTTRRVSGLLTELSTLGLISATVVNYGRYGRTKKIIPQVTFEVAAKAFESTDAIKHLVSS